MIGGVATGEELRTLLRRFPAGVAVVPGDAQRPLVYVDRRFVAV